MKAYLVNFLFGIGSLFLSGCGLLDREANYIQGFDVSEVKTFANSSPQIRVDLDAVGVGETHFEAIVSSEKSKYIFGEPIDVLVIEDSIYVADVQHNNIWVADRTNGIVRSIGQEGQGPGEFLQPYQIEFNGENIFVYDFNNRRVQVFDINFSYLNSFPFVFSPFASQMCVNDKAVYAPSIQEPDSFLVSIISVKDEYSVVGRALPRLVNVGEQPLAMNSVRVVCDDDRVYAVYSGLPYLFIFDEEMSLISSVEFSGEVVDKLNDKTPSRVQFSNDSAVPIKTFFNCLATAGNGIVYFCAGNMLYTFDPVNSSVIQARSYASHSFKNIYIERGRLYMASKVSGNVFVSD